jgi:hypothetical protein
MALLYFCYLLWMTVTGVPFLSGSGGWLPVAACVLWSFGMACSSILVLLRWRSAPKSVWRGIVISTILLAISFGPPIVTAIVYGAEACAASVGLAFLTGWGTLYLWACFESRKIDVASAKSLG